MNNLLVDKPPLPEYRVLELLATLPAGDLKKIRAYGSMTAAEDKTLLRLLDICIDTTVKHHKNNNVAFPNRATIYTKLYNATNYETNKERLLSKIRSVHNLIEQFIAWKQLQNDPVKIQHYVCEYLAGTDAQEIFEHQWDKWAKLLASTPSNHHNAATAEQPGTRPTMLQGHELFFQTMMLHLTRETHWAFDRVGNSMKDFTAAQQTYIDFLQEGSRCAVLVNQGIKLKVEQHKTTALPDVQSGLSNHSQTPLINLYHQICKLFYEGPLQQTEWQAFIHQYKVIFKHIDHTQRIILFRIQVNICIQQYTRLNDISYINSMCELYRWHAEQEEFALRWVLSPADYLNGVIAIGLSENWKAMKHFMETYARQLPKSIRESTFALARAYYFYNGEQDVLQAYEQLKSIRQYKLILGPRIHSLRLRIMYDLSIKEKDIDKIEAEIDAFVAYFKDKQDKFQEKDYVSYKRLGELVRQMLSIFKQQQFGDVGRYSKRDLIENLNDLSKPRPIAYEWLKKRVEIL